MDVNYLVKEKTGLISKDELVVYFWQKGTIDLKEKDRKIIEKTHIRFLVKGEKNEQCIVPYPMGGKMRTVLTYCLGENPEVDSLRRGVAVAAQYAKTSAIRKIVFMIPDVLNDGVEVGSAVAEGLELGTYSFAKYQLENARVEADRKIIEVIIEVAKKRISTVRRGIKKGKTLSEAAILARDLVNEPAKHSSPSDLVEVAKQIADKSQGVISVEIFNREQCAEKKMGAFLAVAQGATDEPFFIHLSYKPEKLSDLNVHKKIALVGKGITFDSGGLSIKPADSMETMKCDMAGAAAVLGVFSVLEKIKPDVVVDGYIAACENMPSGGALMPGDVIRSASGKTIEVRNTDAEGRLTLADSITEALKNEPDHIIDIATLTGACVVALGEEVIGVFSNDQLLAEEIMKAAQSEGEQMWPMPLVDDYRQLIKSQIADIRNVSLKRWGGAITAALFIEAFVEGKSWVHLDIAGPAYSEQQVNPVNPVGGSGAATRTILRYLQSISKK